MIQIENLHHVSVPVTDIGRAKYFYGTVLGLPEMERPAFSFPGLWYKVGEQALHLIRSDDQTFRVGKEIDSRDTHFAIRVRSFAATLDHLTRQHRYSEQSEDPLLRIRVSTGGAAGFPQIFLLDPDRNVVELNAAENDRL